MSESGRPSYRELAEAVKAFPTKQMVPDQRVWDWWNTYGEMVARIPEHIG